MHHLIFSFCFRRFHVYDCSPLRCSNMSFGASQQFSRLFIEHLSVNASYLFFNI